MAAAIVASWFPGDGRVAIVIAVALVFGLGLMVLALTRFELFLMVLIGSRASLDVMKLSSSSVDATGAVSVLFIGAALIWLIRERRTVVASSVDRLLLPFSALFLAGLLSVAFSSHPLESALEAVRIGTVVVIVAALSRVVTDEDRVRMLLWAVFASTVIPLSAAALQLLSGGGLITPDGLSRIRGTFLHPNPFGMYLCLILVLAAATFPHIGRWRWAMLPFALVCAGLLIATYARGAWLATIIGLLVVAALQSRWLLWVLAAAVILIALTVPSVGLRLADLSQERAPSGAPGNSLAWRIQYWKEALSLQDDPVAGIGLREVELTQPEAKAPHNDFVRVYVEMGMLGLFAYVWLLVALYTHTIGAVRRAPPGLARGLAIASFATLSSLAVLSITSNVVSQLVILWYFVAIVFLGLVASERMSRHPARMAA